MKLELFPEVADLYQQHTDIWHNCVTCEIGTFSRYHVFARGTLPCEVLFIGEAPGVTEDLTGYPFVGKSGELLDEWILYAKTEFHDAEGQPDDAKSSIFDYAITNTVLCRPCNSPGADNRAPTRTEKDNCFTRLLEFVDTIAQPKVVVALGKHADETVKALSFPWLHLKHPAYILRKGGRGSSEDLEARRKLADFLVKELACSIQ